MVESAFRHDYYLESCHSESTFVLDWNTLVGLISKQKQLGACYKAMAWRQQVHESLQKATSIEGGKQISILAERFSKSVCNVVTATN